MDFKRSDSRLGFVFHFECISPTGEVLWIAREENIIPDEGRDYILNAALNAGAQFSTWYIGLYEGSYAPQAGDTMALFPSSGVANEILTYSEANRVALVDEPLSGGLFANSVTMADFTFTANKTVRGGFISSGATKGGTTGVLLSAVQSSSPKIVASGEILRVVAGLSLVTV